MWVKQKNIIYLLMQTKCLFDTQNSQASCTGSWRKSTAKTTYNRNNAKAKPDSQRGIEFEKTKKALSKRI